LYKRLKKVIELSTNIYHVDELKIETYNRNNDFCFIHAGNKLYANYSETYSYDVAFGLSGNIHNVKKMLQLLSNLQNAIRKDISASTVYMHEPLNNKNDIYDKSGEYDFDKIYEDHVKLYIIKDLTNNIGVVGLNFDEKLEVDELCK
jgi:hypothetical protein